MIVLFAVVALACAPTSQAHGDRPGGLSPADRVTFLISHAPIFIYGNAAFTPSNGVIGGNGSPDDPYVIAGWDIDASALFGIHVEATDASFVIENVSIHSGGQDWQAILFYNVSNAMIRDANLTDNAEGISVSAGQNVVIQDNRIVGQIMSGLYINSRDVEIRRNHLERNENGVVTTRNASNVTLEDNTFAFNRYGMIGVQSSNVTAANNTFIGDSVYGIELLGASDYIVEGNSFSGRAIGLSLEGSHRVRLRGNAFDRGGVFVEGTEPIDFDSHSIASDNSVDGLPLIYRAHCTDQVIDGASVGQVIIASCAGVTVKNMEFSARGLPILIAFSGEVNVSANVLSNNTLGGIRLFEVRNATVMNNHAVESGRASISMDRVMTARISGNVFLNGSAFEASSSTGLSFLGNVLHNTTSARFEGTFVIPPDPGNNTTGRSLGNLTIGGNEFAGGGDGIVLLATRDVNISLNRIERALGYGIFLGNVRNARLIGNLLNNTKLASVLLSDSTNATLSGNRIQNSEAAGVELYMSRDIRVFGNEFSENAIQALDNRGLDNSWNADYPMGGNAWSNYSGPDACSGVNQDVCPDPDGIGDVPFVIDSDSQDRYPIVNTAPTADFSVSPTIGNATTVFSVNASSSSDREDPLAALEVRWDWEGDGTWDTLWSTTKTADHMYAAGGRYTIRLEVRDTGQIVRSSAAAILVDFDPPTVLATSMGTQGANGWFRSSIQVTLTAQDDLSGVASVSYRIDGGVWTAYSGPFVVGEGHHTLEYYGTDLAGVVEPVQSLVFEVDTVSPTTVASLGGTLSPSGWYTTPVTVTLASDDSTSGVAMVSYRVDESAWLDYSGPFAIEDGRHAVEFFATDTAGNVGAGQSLAVDVDTTPPVLENITPVGPVTKSSVTVAWRGIDQGSGILRYELSVDGGAFESIGTATTKELSVGDGDHVVRIRAFDAAGNSALAEVKLHVDTNVFSFQGPYAGMPTIALVIAGASIAALLLLKRRRRPPTRPEDRPKLEP